MRIIDKILGVFGIRRIILDKPLTLLGQDYDNCWWKGRRKASAPRTVGEDRQRIMRDVSENL